MQDVTSTEDIKVICDNLHLALERVPGVGTIGSGRPRCDYENVWQLYNINKYCS